MENTMYGVWSTASRQFIFGISEPTRSQAKQKLVKEIGRDAFQPKFQVRKITEPKKQGKVEKEKKPTKREILETADYVIAKLKEQGIIIQRYDSMTTNSVYLKFDYGVLNSLRISDHKGKAHLSYRYNIQHGVQTSHKTITGNGWDRWYFPFSDIDKAILRIMADRREKMVKYGWVYYVDFMEKNVAQNSDTRGFWSQAQLV